ncbi:hypothetical protein ND16A_1749 [Thalassotalea sp. ND16A]|nr:hypothetical protein ND16A_1749 [Thalassotalea sp. ND16A]
MVFHAFSKDEKGKGLYTVLFILLRTLQECIKLENTGAHSPE